jgi:hypothetical protein
MLRFTPESALLTQASPGIMPTSPPDFASQYMSAIQSYLSHVQVLIGEIQTTINILAGLVAGITLVATFAGVIFFFHGLFR